MTLATRIIAWLALGHLIIGALFWGLLKVPESTVWMLALTAALALLIVAVTAIVEAKAVLWWQSNDGPDAVTPSAGERPEADGRPDQSAEASAKAEGLPLQASMPPTPPTPSTPTPSTPPTPSTSSTPSVASTPSTRTPLSIRSGRALALPAWLPALRRWLPARPLMPSLPYGRAFAGFALAVVVFGIIYWLTGRADAWWSQHRGEVDAWMMMRTRSPRTLWLTAVVEWLIWAVRYPVALSLAVGLFGAWLRSALRVRPVGWLRSSLHWRPLLGITLALLLFIMLPWRYVYWRPESLPPNWMEPAFVGVKLFIVYVLINTGWAIVLSAGARRVE